VEFLRASGLAALIAGRNLEIARRLNRILGLDDGWVAKMKAKAWRRGCGDIAGNVKEKKEGLPQRR
jgi:hypothetical protein